MALTTIVNCSNSSSSIIYSENEDFLHNFDFKSIADLKQVHREKILIVVGTIKQLCAEGECNNHDIDWLPHTCTILASSLCGLLLYESYDPDEYVSKILFVIKPTTSDAKWIPFPTSEYTATKFALVVISSNPLHFKVIRLSYTKPSDMLTEKVDYDYYNIEFFSSTTW
ncbi:unnamed protein product [Lactuca saligna]|uniref:Uncharacterized protein n=1 Tax=Lactuca saligna TaxID=75948 RepID=A0AA35ZSP8_LACSI|nr:unnamed protein product [Lactuca saligna]